VFPRPQLWQKPSRLDFLLIIDSMSATTDDMMQTGIFEDLQRKIDEDTAVKDVCLSQEFCTVEIARSRQYDRLYGILSRRSRSKVLTDLQRRIQSAASADS